MEQICKDLLGSWCGSLLRLQIRDQKEPTLQGGILCPACGMIHGRCFDAIYPFLYLADQNHDEVYRKGAELLFDWAEHTVSREDGSYVNDVNSQWKGTTAFSVIQLVEALSFHGHVLKKEVYERWKMRVEKAADFLAGFREYEVCNVNYRITCSLAMELCAEFLGKEQYRTRAHELIRLSQEQLTESGILVGEGRPTDGFSPRGCRPVDIGYNLEESLPSFLQYAVRTGNHSLTERLVKAWKRHLLFVLDDGSMDNSFGTRNYKWTYWGSRTSDGCALGFLLAAQWEPDLGVAAFRNLTLLRQCTVDGILYGGPHVSEIGEPPCIHHTFCHAKVLAGILDQGLWTRLHDGQLPRSSMKQAEYVKELDTCIIPGKEYTATVTSYDWEYRGLPEGHAGGGTLSLLRHQKAGLVLCAGMNQYSLKEPYNMILPRHGHHRCTTPRLELQEDGVIYSNIYDHKNTMTWERKSDYVTAVDIQGCLTDMGRNQAAHGNYRIHYLFKPDQIYIKAQMPKGARWILPVVSLQKEEVTVWEHYVIIWKYAAEVKVDAEKGKLSLPLGSRRIYNLAPGVEALQIDMEEEDGKVAFSLSFRYDGK